MNNIDVNIEIGYKYYPTLYDVFSMDCEETKHSFGINIEPHSNFGDFLTSMNLSNIEDLQEFLYVACVKNVNAFIFGNKNAEQWADNFSILESVLSKFTNIGNEEMTERIKRKYTLNELL